MGRNQIHKRVLSLFLSFTLILSIFGVDTVGAQAVQSSSPTVLSLDSGNILITDSGYSVGGGPITAQGPSDSGYFISGSTAQHTIAVSGVGLFTRNITIHNVNIDVSGTPNACAFSIAKGARVNLTLEGTNTLKSGQNCAGLEIPGDSSFPEDPTKNASLTIMADSTGMLTATGGEYGSGIGGSKNGTCGSITINGGTITATSGGGGVGIGGGTGGSDGTIEINGGIVTTIGGNYGGAGIGAGVYGTGGTITVTGGIVMATGGGAGAGIGGGDGGSNGTIKINGGIVTSIGGNYGGAGIGGGANGTGGTVTISDPDTQVTAKGQGASRDIGWGEIGGHTGSLTVSNGATVALLGSGTTVDTPSYTSCQIITGSSEMKYDLSHNGTPVALLTSTLTAEPAAGGQTGPMQFTAKAMNGSTPVTDGTFTFAYSGAKDSGNVPDADSVSIGQDGTASCTWTPPANGLTVITAKYKANGYDALKAVFYYDPDAIDLSATGSGGFGYTYGSNTFTINQNGAYVFTGSTSGATANKITVQTGVSADVTLCNANIDASANDACPFNISWNASVNLTLTGTNTLQSGRTYAALLVPNGACLTVTAQSSGTLDAAVYGNNALGAGIGGCRGTTGTGTIIIKGGNITASGTGDGLRGHGQGYGAGIGGGVREAGGTVTINGGTVKAISRFGAGIGGGCAIAAGNIGGAGGTVIINGGTVTAQSAIGAGIGGGAGDTGGAGGTITITGGKITADGNYGGGSAGAGIGGGYGSITGGAGGTVTIIGGFVTAKRGSNSMDIGGGTSGSVGTSTGGGPVGSDGTNVFWGGSIAAGSVSPQPVISSGTPTKVYKTSAQLPSVSAETDTICTANGHSFSTQTDAQGFLYVWLPESAAASYSILNESTAVSYLAKGAVNSAASVNPLSVFCTADVDLAGLTIQGQPAAFDGTATYSCSFGSSVAALAKSDFVPAFHGTGDTWKLFGDSRCTQELSSLNLNTGENTAYLKVTSPDGTTSKIYRLKITRGTSPNANLAGLSVKTSGANVPLSPAFGADILNYTATVGSGVSEVTVTPAVSEPSAAFTVNGKTPAVGQTGVNITLNGAGQTTPISVKVTAQNGTTVKIYTLNIARAAAPSNSSGGSSHGTSTPSLPSSLTDTPTRTTVDLTGATFPAWVTGISLAVTPETANGTSAAPGNAGLPADPQGAEVYHLVITQTGLNLIGSPFVYNIQLLDQNGNSVSFTGSVMVRIPNPAGIHGMPHVFRYEEKTNTFTDLGATVQDGYLVFSTTHLSYYVIAGTGDSITLDTKNYQMPIGSSYQIGTKLTGKKNIVVKTHSTNDGIATATQLTNGNVQVHGKDFGTAYVMFDVYDDKHKLLAHVSTRIDVKTGIRPRGDSTRQIGVYTVPDTADSLTIDTKSYEMPVDGKYQIGAWLTEGKATAVKNYSTNSKIASVTKLTNDSYQVKGKNPGTAYIMFDVYDSKNRLLTHVSMRIDVKTGIRPRGDSTRQYGIF